MKSINPVIKGFFLKKRLIKVIYENNTLLIPIYIYK